MAEYPENFIYQSSDKTLHWNGVTDAEEYRIEYATDPLQVIWPAAYSGGTALSCSFDKTPGTYYVKGKAKKKGTWGDFGPYETIEVTP